MASSLHRASHFIFTFFGLLCVCGRCAYSLLAGLFYLIGTGATNAMLVAVYVLHKQGQAKAFWQ